MNAVYLLMEDDGYQEQWPIGIYSTLDYAMIAARRLRDQGRHAWRVYETKLDQENLREVWATMWSTGPSSDGLYGWREEDKTTGAVIIEHVRTPEGYLYPHGFEDKKLIAVPER